MKISFFAAHLMLVYSNPCILSFALHWYLTYLVNIPRVNNGKRTPKKTFAWVMLCLILRMIKFREPVQENDLFGPLIARNKEEASSVHVTRMRKNSTHLCRYMVLTHRQHEWRSYGKTSTCMRGRPNFTSLCRKNETQRTSKRSNFAGVNSECYPYVLFECVWNPRTCAGKCTLTDTFEKAVLFKTA